MTFLKRNQLPSYLLLLYLVDYLFPSVFGAVALFLFDSSSLQSAVKPMLLILLPITLFIFRERTNKCKSIERTVLPFFIVFLYVQTIYFASEMTLKMFINIVLFLFLCKYVSCDICDKYCWYVKILSLVACIPVIFYCVVNHNLYFYRDSVFIEKQTLSILLMLAYTICMIDLFVGRKKRNLNLGILVFLTGINLFVIQSKSSLFTLVMAAIILFFTKKTVRQWLKKKFIYFLLGYFVVLLAFPSLALPDDIRFGVNRFVGTKIFSTNYTRMEERMEVTYSVRDDVRELCFHIFRQNPFLGIGVGNFATYNKYSNSKVSFLGEPESTWLSVITEGGLLYALCMILFFAANIYYAYRRARIDDNDVYAYRSLLVNICFCVMFVFNDFMDTLFWVSSGVVVGAAYYEGAVKKNDLYSRECLNGEKYLLG